MKNLQSSEHFGPLMGYCDHQVQILMVRMLKEYDVSPMQCRTLTFLHMSREKVSQKQLEKHLMIKPSTVNGIVGRLVEKGLLCRTASDTDARSRLLHLTEQGERFCDDLADIMERMNGIMEACFTPEERTTLNDLLSRLAEHLTKEVQQ